MIIINIIHMFQSLLYYRNNLKLTQYVHKMLNTK